MEIDVVGGGVFGCATAMALADRGHKVVVHETKMLGSGATSKAEGILSTMVAWNDDDYALIARSRTILESLQKGGKIRAWTPHPSIAVVKRNLLPELRKIERRIGADGERPSLLTPEEARREFPGLSFADDEAILQVERDGVIRPRDLVELLRVELKKRRVGVRESSAHRIVRGTRNVCVVAGGAWTAPLLRGIGVQLPAKTYRSQVAEFELAGSGQVPMVNDLVHHFSTRPETEATTYFGDGTELREFAPDEFPEQGDSSFEQKVRDAVPRRFIHARKVNVLRSWAGLHVGTPDRRPLCGRVTQSGETFVLTGDNGFGLMRGLALGERAADAVEGREPQSTSPTRFDLTRSLDFETQEGFHWA